ncbi:MAG: adenylosuccinate lyase [Proteobacteria bacterium]|nr:adenylosuccinate lyase [Pseudomonadota bacterium]
MIDRYKTEEMSKIFDDINRFGYWLKVELAVCKAWNKLGKIPDDQLKNILDNASFDIDRINEIEKTTNHDVISFLTSVAEKVGPSSRFIHMGMTSSDMLDTALALQIKDALDILIKEIDNFSDIVLKRAEETKYLPVIGRTHGIHAEITTIGLKLLSFYAEIKRNLRRIERIKDEIAVGKISGAVGNYANLSPEVENTTMEFLGLKADEVSTQVISRDRHANLLTVLAIYGATIERIAVDIRSMQRTEIGEFEEPFKEGQKGSSAMPHKRNPILSERMVGMARLLRSNSIAAMENVALWDERDISHSSVERVIIPDSFHLTLYMTKKMEYILKYLYIRKDNIGKNINLTNGVIFSQRVLLKLIEKGATREDAYKVVQENAMVSWKEKRNFKDLIKNDPIIKELIGENEIEECFDVGYYTKYVDFIFNRVKEV